MRCVTRAILGDMEIDFKRPLQIVGVDEYNVYLVDFLYTIDELPYIRTFTKEWMFVDSITGCCFKFDYEIK